MGNEFALSSRDACAYLERIGLGRPEQPTREALDDLVYAHQCSIPFETIDMYRCAEPPDLALDRVFDKLITRHRGGYCFELNALFEALLASLGYEVRPCLCRAVCGAKVKDPINHRAVLVNLDGEEVLADVGFGGPLPSASLSLVDGQEQIIRGESFTARRIDDYWWAVDRVTGAKKDLYGIEGPSRTQTELELCLAAVTDKDFAALNLACSQPGMEFYEHRIANLRTKTGYYGIWDDTLTVRERGEKIRTALADEAAFADACERYFGFRPHGA